MLGEPLMREPCRGHEGDGFSIRLDLLVASARASKRVQTKDVFLDDRIQINTESKLIARFVRLAKQ